MPAGRVPARFLLRASAALVLLSAVWWAVLLKPLLFSFRQIGDFAGSVAFGRASCDFISETPSGDWNICIPVDGVRANQGRPGSSRINSIEFEIARSGPLVFTFGLPVCWALLLAARQNRTWLRRLVLGSGVTALLELVLLLAFLRTYVSAVQAQSVPTPDAMTKWFFDFSLYLEASVGPVVTPFLVALVFQRELRDQILGRTEANNWGLPSTDMKTDGRQETAQRLSRQRHKSRSANTRGVA